MWLPRERFAEIDMGVPSSRTARSSGIPIARVPSSRSMQRCNDATDNASRRVRRMLASRLAAGLFVIEGITSSADCVCPSARRQALLVSTTGRAPVTVTELSNRPNSWTMMWIVRVWGLCFLAIRWGLRDDAVLWFAALRALIGMMGVVNVTSAFGAMFAGVPGLSTEAASVLRPATPANIAPNALVTFTTPIMPMSARSAANRNTAASRRPHRIARKHSPPDAHDPHHRPRIGPIG